jgi:transcriptional regulator with XRE-family HTH domain
MPGSLDDSGFNAQLGRRIRSRRKQLSMSQSTLASRLGLSFQAVQKYESGDSSPPPMRLIGMAEALRVPISYFFEGLGPASGVNEDAGLSDRDLRTIGRLRQLPADVRAAIEKVIAGALRNHAHGMGGDRADDLDES